MTSKKLLTRAAIFIIMRDPAGRVLLQQRTNTGYMDGYYDFACSGHVDEGEAIHEAAVRELEEELGIVANPEHLRLVHINQNYIDTPYINFTFELSQWQGIPEIKEPEKCSDLAYFDTGKLPDQCTLNVRVNQRASFSHELTYSKVTQDIYADVLSNTAELK